MKKLTEWVKESKQKKASKDSGGKAKQPTEPQERVGPSVKDTIQRVKTKSGKSSDLIYREFNIGVDGKIKAGVIYTDGLVDQNFVQDFIVKTLMLEVRDAELEPGEGLDHFQLLEKFSLPAGDVKVISTMEQLYDHLLSGDTILLVDGFEKGFAVSSRGWADRGIQEPGSETVVRGPKDGFTETLRINTALIRRKIKDPELRIDAMKIGKRTKTDIAIVYLNGVANEKIVKEVKKRMNRIDIDGVLEGGYIEEFIQDDTYTPFPTVFNSERPDRIAAGLLEGRVAIIVDGTPFVLLVPALFVQFFQASEDYYQRADISTLIRLLRYLSFFLALLVPSAYIAVTTYHQEMLPTTLLVSLAAQREGSPFPAVVEAAMMEITFEILREAGVRMPRAVGSAISIVGALVLGQAAVEAGIVSAAMVIVVSLTAISSFVFPEFNMAISVRILRFLFMILAATFGLFGMILGLIVLVLHLSSLRSFGVPYMLPVGPLKTTGQQDSLFRLPHWSMKKRPGLMSQKNPVRESTPPPQPQKNQKDEGEW